MSNSKWNNRSFIIGPQWLHLGGCTSVWCVAANSPKPFGCSLQEREQPWRMGVKMSFFV